MAYTTPRTWADAEIPSASMFNTHVRDNLNAIGEHAKAYKTADETTTGVTVQDDDVLFFPVGIAQVWAFRAYISFANNVGASGDFRLTFTGPSGSTGFWAPLPRWDTSDAFAFSNATALASELVIGATNTDRAIFVDGSIEVGATAGNLRLRWAEGTAGAWNMTVRANSWLLGNRLA